VPLGRAIGPLRLLDPLAVERDVDVGRVELHEGVDRGEYAAHAVALERRQQFECEAGFPLREGAVYEFCDVHDSVC